MRQHDAQVLLEVRLPAGNERGPAFMEQVLTTLLQANPERLPVSLILRCVTGRTAMLIDVPASLHVIVVSQIHAAYPDARIVPEISPCSIPFESWNLHLLAQPEVASLKRAEAFIETTERAFTDPLAALLLALESVSPKGSASITLRLRPAASTDVDRAKRLHQHFESSLLRRWPRLATNL